MLRSARRTLLTRALSNGRAVIDDVRDAVPVPPGVNPVAFGAAPGLLAQAGIIQGVGYAKTERPEAHARPVQVLAVVDPVAAHEWLRDHPELPDPDADDGPPGPVPVPSGYPTGGLIAAAGGTA